MIIQDETSRDKEKAKNNHIKAKYSGQLIGQYTFYIGCSKGIRRTYHQAVCDCLSSFGVAEVYNNKTTKVSTDFV